MTETLTTAQRLRVYAMMEDAEEVILRMPPDRALQVAALLEAAEAKQDQMDQVLARVASCRHATDVLQEQLLLRARWWWVALALVEAGRWLA